MSEKNVLKGMKVKACGLSDDKPVTPPDGEPSVFYRRPCSECGKDAIDLIDSGVSMRSPVLGITSDGEIGCSHTELEGDCELGIYCRSCGHEVCRAFSETGEVGDEFLSEWAKISRRGSHCTALRLPKVPLAGTSPSRGRHRVFTRCCGRLRF